MSWTEHPEAEILIASYKEKGVYIEPKTGWFWEAISWLLYLITFTVYKRELFLKKFATTIGTKVGIPLEWSYVEAENVMPHEARHVWQGKVCGFGISAWLGIPIFALLYAFLPLPIGLAYFRYLFEKSATRETIRHMKKKGVSLSKLKDIADHHARSVSSSDYIWTVPKSFAINGYRKMVYDVVENE